MKIKYIGTSIITLGDIGKLIPNQEFDVENPKDVKLILGKPLFVKVRDIPTEKKKLEV